MKSNKLTLKQLADKLDVSKSYIDKIIRILGMHTQLEKEGNRYVLNARQQKVVEDFIKSKKSHIETHTKFDDSVHSNESSEVDFLRLQLNERNKEIENLHKILDQQQQLQLKIQNLLENQRSLSSKNTDAEISEKNKELFEVKLTNLKNELQEKDLENTLLKQQLIELSETKKKGFFQRFFS